MEVDFGWDQQGIVAPAFACNWVVLVPHRLEMTNITLLRKGKKLKLKAAPCVFEMRVIWVKDLPIPSCLCSMEKYNSKQRKQPGVS